MKTVSAFKRPVDYLGESVKMHLKDGAVFEFKVTGCGPNHFDGYDDEGMNLTIAFVDIDTIIGR